MKPTSRIAKLLHKKQQSKKQVSDNYVSKIVLPDNFPAQNDFINDPNPFVAALCSRRAGKTSGLILRFFKAMEKHPNSQCLYLGLTHQSAKEIMWQPLQEFAEMHNIPCEFLESKSTMVHPNGSELKIMGADLKNFIKRIRGRKYPAIAVDEAQDFGTHLETLIDDVLSPSMIDYEDRWLALTGTPGPVPHGYFFKVTQEKKFGYSLHKWTLLDNPHIPNPAAFIDTLKKNKEWTSDNPTLRREWQGEWVLDTNSLWVRYDEKVNNYKELPKLSNYILGVDIGFRDSDAIAVIGWDNTSKDIYLVEEIITPKQGITELSDQIQEMIKKYDPQKIVMDEGGLGKKIAEEMRKRQGLPIHPADKARKQENVEFLNDYMRLGKFKASSESRFVMDSYLVQIDWSKSTPNKIVIKKDPHSDIIDAVLYAFKESPAWTNEAIKQRSPYGTPDWMQEEEEQMLENTIEYLQKQQEIDENHSF